MVTAAEFGTGEVFLSMLWFFLFLIWIWMLIAVLTDTFRSDDLSGWAKALWALFVIVLPYLGVFVYLIVRGRTMGERGLRLARERDAATRAYIRDAAGPPGADGSSPAQEIARLAELRDRGVISSVEFDRAKAKVLDG